MRKLFTLEVTGTNTQMIHYVDPVAWGNDTVNCALHGGLKHLLPDHRPARSNDHYANLELSFSFTYEVASRIIESKGFEREGEGGQVITTWERAVIWAQ